MKKVLRAIFAALILFAIVIIGLMWVFAPAIARQGIKKGATYALGVDTRVETLSLSLVKGQFGINGLKIDNPDGFESEHLMKSGQFEIEAIPLSLLGNTVELRKFVIDGLELNIEQKLSGNNVSKIIANLKRLSSGREKQKKAGGKKLRVDKISIRNVTVNIKIPIEIGEVKSRSIKVPAIELTNVTSDNAKGVLVSELVSRLFPVIIAAVLNEGGGILPDGLLKDLKLDISGLAEAMGKGGKELLQQVGGEIEELIEEKADEVIEKLEKKIGDKLGEKVGEEVGEGMGNTLKGFLDKN